MRKLLTALLEALFRVLFTYDCLGEENVPASGPAVVAANHPSYMDPILLSLQVARPIRFMAWDALFKVPLLGALMQACGAFPVDPRKGKGREAYARAKALVEAGEVVGIFPEGKRSQTGWMEPTLREGAARLAWETGAPLLPATIAGAFRAWPHYQSLPHPARIRVRFHEPIDPAPYRDQPEEQALPALLAEIRKRVERSLLPGVKADLKTSVLYRLPAPRPRLHEILAPLLAAGLVLWKTHSLFVAALPGLYLLYLGLDVWLLPQRRLLKWLRNASAPLFVLSYAQTVGEAWGLPRVPAAAALLAVLAGAAFPYLYEHGRTALEFLRGLVIAAGLSFLTLLIAPTGLGPHVALPAFAAACAWERRTVFWRYAVPVLVAHAVFIPLLLHGMAGALSFHALAGLLAWLLTRLFPYHRPARQAAGSPSLMGLGLDFPDPADDKDIKNP